MKFKDLFKALNFRVTIPWPGEKKLSKPMDRSKTITKQEIEQEIRKSLTKGGHDVESV